MRYLTGSINSSPVVSSDGIVYFGSDTCDLNAINGVKGTLKWKTSLGSTCTVYSTPTLSSKNIVYIGTDNLVKANFWAINMNTGAYIWSYATGALIRSGTGISPDGQYIYYTADQLYAFTSTTGTLAWKFPIGVNVPTDSIQKQAVPVVFNSNLYVGSLSGTLYALTNLTNTQPSVLWTFSANPFEKIGSNVAISNYNGILYFNAYYAAKNMGNIYGVNITTGQLFYKTITNVIIRTACGIDSNGIIYVGTGNNSLYPNGGLAAFHPNLTSYWVYKTPNAEVYTHPAIDRNNNIIFGSDEGDIYTVNSQGLLLAKSVSFNALVRTSPAIGTSGIIYIGTLGNELIGLGNNPYDKFTPDNKNSNNEIFQLGLPALVGILLLILVVLVSILAILYYCYKKQICFFSKRNKHQILKTFNLVDETNYELEMLLSTANNNNGLAIFTWKDFQVGKISHTKMSTNSSTNHTNNTDNNNNNLIIGQGSFGEVILAQLIAKNTNKEKKDNKYITTEKTVIKIFKTKNNKNNKNDHIESLKMAIKEAQIHSETEKKILNKNCIVKVYGIVYGELSRDLSVYLNTLYVAGVVMRYEEGGALSSIIHNNNNNDNSNNNSNLVNSNNNNVSNDTKNDDEDIINKTIHTTATQDLNNSNSINNRNDDANKSNNNNRNNNYNDEDGYNNNTITLELKIRILLKIAIGLAELHKAGTFV